MPRYFFDTNDGDTFVKDEAGWDLDKREDARRQALAVIGELAKEVLPDGDHRELTVAVRDESGAVVYRAVLTLNGGWC